MNRIYMFCALGLIVFGVTGANAQNHPHYKMVWQTEPVFQTPEAVLYDAKRDLLYVGNYRRTDPNATSEFLSKVGTDGTILALKWVSGLDRPTGMAIYRDKLYVVERDKLTRINIDAERVEDRVPIVGARFSNDVTFDSKGIAYISDNGQDPETCIFRYKDGRIVPWMTAEQILRPNGLFIDGSNLVCFDNRRQALVRIDPNTKKLTEIAQIKSDARAIGDGIVKVADQTYLVTAWSGESWIVGPGDKVKPCLDTNALKPVVGQRVNHADVGYVPQKKLWIIPTFFDHRLLAYELR